MKNQTLDYYTENAEKFIGSTIDVDFSDTQNRFLSKLKAGAGILDFGCGSGRDTKYFLEHGYQVEAMDGSKELCTYATQFTGIEVRQMLFQELSEKNRYDAIWACSSILHLPKEGLRNVFVLMAEALKENGIVYTSFKYSSFEGYRNGRYFTDFTLEGFLKFLKDIDRFVLEENWITGDVRAGRGDERWLNVILRKN